MIWGPFLLALALGLVVSAGLYFAYLWPQVEPDDDVDGDAPHSDRARAASPTKAEAATAEPASEATAEPASEATAEPASESSPA